MTRTIKYLLNLFNVGITSKNNLDKLRRYKKNSLLYSCFEDHESGRLNEILVNSKSQLQQDIFVLSELQFKRNGYFVEFGATDGVKLSNTYLLEKKFDWTGILSEPCKMWHSDLMKNRNCEIETLCIWSESNSILKFSETVKPELSTISSMLHSDHHNRSDSTFYNVQTISLSDLLDKYNAPKSIDYLSIDTEGSEYEILRTFDFKKFEIKIITVEHNYTSNREKIFKLLIQNGYVRKYVGISQQDDWYIRK